MTDDDIMWICIHHHWLTDSNWVVYIWTNWQLVLSDYRTIESKREIYVTVDFTESEASNQSILLNIDSSVYFFLIFLILTKTVVERPAHWKIYRGNYLNIYGDSVSLRWFLSILENLGTIRCFIVVEVQAAMYIKLSLRIRLFSQSC